MIAIYFFTAADKIERSPFGEKLRRITVWFDVRGKATREYPLYF
jgi:hypothetical protein